MTQEKIVHLTVNSKPYEVSIEPRKSLADTLREDLGFTGTHLGCEHGVCGACTVLLDGEPVRSCLLLGVQVEGANVTTIEGLSADGALTPLQQAFSRHHALQCGFCTPGMILTATKLLERNPQPSRDEITEALSGNLCRCTGYENIVKAVMAVETEVEPREANV